MGQRKKHTPQLKTKVAVEALKERKTTAQIASQFEVHSAQVSAWKKQALDILGEGFKGPAAISSGRIFGRQRRLQGVSQQLRNIVLRRSVGRRASTGMRLLCRSSATSLQRYREHEPPASYSRFCRYLKPHANLPAKPACRLNHIPGERTQIDYADGVWITNRKTGTKTKCQLFCGVLPRRSRNYAEFSTDQKLASFIRSQERMRAYFGGVTPYVVVDYVTGNIIRHQNLTDITKVGECPIVRGNPVDKGLRPGRLSKGIATGSQDRDKDLGVVDFASLGVVDRYRLTSIF